MRTYLGVRQKRMTIFTVILLFISLLSPMTSFAEESELSFQVQPNFPESQMEGSTSYFDLELPVGAKDNLGLTIRNTSTKEITVQITAHTAFTNVNGVVEYGKEAEEKDPTILYAMDELIDTPEPIVLAAGEERALELPFRMPEESFEGLLAGGLRIEEVLEESTSEEDGQGLAIKNQFSFVIGVLASNNRSTVVPELELVDVFADQLNYRNVFSARIQNSTPTFVNQLEVTATVRAKGDNERVYESETSGMQMAPNSHFSYPIPLNGEAFRNGDYVASLTARSGEHEWNWEQEFTINQETARRLNQADVTVDTSTNWWMIVAGALFVLLVLGIGYVLYKIRERKKEEKQRQQIKQRIARRKKKLTSANKESTPTENKETE